MDLGASPIANNFLKESQLSRMEPFYPLHAYVCEHCFLVQLEEIVSPADLFTEYAYFSSYSDSWLRHAKTYADMVIDRFALGSHSRVVEIASNDGYLLQFFIARGVPVLGIEPAANVANAALAKGIPTVIRFFGEALAQELVGQGTRADLIVGNNVLAHVPKLNDFVTGMKALLGPQGVITMEFPHLMRLMEEGQFDTIYHEHFSYFSFTTVEKIFGSHGLTIFDVEELPTHGGSLRIYACHAGDTEKKVADRVTDLRGREDHAGFTRLKTYHHFGERVKENKRRILDFLIRAKQDGKTIVGYGAPAKGNTLLNYCGIRSDFIDYTVDRSPYKQGYFTPGTHIPIYGPEKIKETRPDYLFILHWNLKEEVMEQMSYIRDWGGKFVVPIPNVEVL